MRPAFTGKETDCETGFSYFGARYYDPTLLTSFLSIDRYADKYPSLSPYHYCAWNPMKLTDPSGDSIKIFHWISDGNQGGKYYSGHLNRKTAKQLENFAKTKEGYAFLSQYATKGQKIGSVEFTKDGIYANHNLTFLEFNAYGASAGTFSYKKGGRNMQFYIQINAAYMNDENGVESYAITLGHEMFLHMDRIDDKLINAYNSDNDAEYLKIVKADAPNQNSTGDVDHKDYINGRYGSRFNKYVSQLKNFLNSTNVDKAKKRHDGMYSKLRNKN